MEFLEQKLNLSNIHITENDNDKYPHYWQINPEKKLIHNYLFQKFYITTPFDLK